MFLDFWNSVSDKIRLRKISNQLTRQELEEQERTYQRHARESLIKWKMYSDINKENGR
jgi:hypothetical protein